MPPLSSRLDLFLQRFFISEDGATAIEYTMLVAFIAGAILVAFLNYTEEVYQLFMKASALFDTGSALPD